MATNLSSIRHNIAPSNLVMKAVIKISVSMYKLLFDLHCKNIYHDKWLLYIKNELYTNGLGIIWDYQDLNIVGNISLLQID